MRGIIVLLEDVTEQRIAERALRESEERFRRIANSAPAMMWVTRLDRTRDFVNEAYAEFACGPGCDHEEARTLDWRERIHPEDFERIVAESIAGEASGKAFTLEARYKRHDGEWRWLRSVSQPRFGPDGELIGFIGVASDITLAKQAELDLRRQVDEGAKELLNAQEQLRQSQKMEALGQLTGGIAHDFNNLLTVVVGGLDIIVKRADDDKLRQYAENALAAAERGARLTGQLLAFSRVQRLEVTPTYVAPIIQNMRPLLRNVLGPGIEKRFDLDEAMMPVMADPTQLEVAVLNLAINARDAMPDGGVLTFATAPVQIAGDPEMEDGDYIELTISDTGTGMPPEVLERAFEPFFTTKEVGKGTGLGLSMVYGMARQSGGGARIESTPGQGTSVKLLFRKADGPIAEAADGADEADGPAAAHGPQSILVIDDDPDVRAFIAASLEEHGYEVHQAADGARGHAELQPQEARPGDRRLHHARPVGRGRRQQAAGQAPRPADPVRFGLQRDRGRAPGRAQRPAAGQTVPRRRARESRARRACGGGLNTKAALRVVAAMVVRWCSPWSCSCRRRLRLRSSCRPDAGPRNLRARLGADELGAQAVRHRPRHPAVAGQAATAARAFRKIADSNGDGRVTPQEYRAARAFILARY